MASTLVNLTRSSASELNPSLSPPGPANMSITGIVLRTFGILASLGRDFQQGNPVFPGLGALCKEFWGRSSVTRVLLGKTTEIHSGTLARLDTRVPADKCGHARYLAQSR